MQSKNINIYNYYYHLNYTNFKHIFKKCLIFRYSISTIFNIKIEVNYLWKYLFRSKVQYLLEWPICLKYYNLNTHTCYWQIESLVIDNKKHPISSLVPDEVEGKRFWSYNMMGDHHFIHSCTHSPHTFLASYIQSVLCQGHGRERRTGCCEGLTVLFQSVRQIYNRRINVQLVYGRPRCGANAQVGSTSASISSSFSWSIGRKQLAAYTSKSPR